MCMSSPKSPKPPKPPPKPESTPRTGDVQMMKAMEDERKKRALSGQRNSSNLTGSQGLETPAVTTKKTMLGQ